MISTKTIENRVKKQLAKVGYDVSVNVMTINPEHSNDYALVISDSIGRSQIYPLDVYDKVSVAQEDIVAQYLYTMQNEAAYPFSRDVLLHSVCPKLITKPMPDCICGKWDNFYVVYYFMLDSKEQFINQTHVENYKLSLEELTEHALHNLAARVKIMSAEEMLQGDLSADVASLFSNNNIVKLSNDVIILQGQDIHDASGVLLLECFFKIIAEETQSDLIILPVDNNFIIETYKHLTDWGIDVSSANETVDAIYEVLDLISKYTNTNSPLANAFTYKRESGTVELL